MAVLPAFAAVDPLADQIRLPGMRRVFGDHVGHGPAQRHLAPPLVDEDRVQRQARHGPARRILLRDQALEIALRMRRIYVVEGGV